MIPHHSSAIFTSENADIQDQEMKQFSNEIIKTQVEEMNMEKLDK